MNIYLDRKRLKSLTVIEIITTLIIIGILATLAVVGYGPSRESLFEREARENLRLIQSAEKLYHARFNSIYYPNVGIQANEADINRFLKLDLPVQNQRWDYRVTHTGCADARSSTDPTNRWRMRIGDSEPTAGALCP